MPSTAVVRMLRFVATVCQSAPFSPIVTAEGELLLILGLAESRNPAFQAINMNMTETLGVPRVN